MRVGLLFGGRSVEHEVSVESARGVAAALRSSAHDCVPIAVDGDGRWADPARSESVLAGESARVPRLAADDALMIRPGEPRLHGALGAVDLDLLFPLIHGWGGEDGRTQGLLELAGVPYVGSGVLGSALAMDKGFAKRVSESHGLASVPWVEFDAAAWRGSPDACRRRIDATLRYPIFVKPSNGGSSVGVSKVASAGELEPAIDRALECDRRLVVEQGIDARELEVAVLGNEAPQASVVGEIEPSREFYDYEAKYVDGTSVLSIPCELDETVAERVRTLALSAYAALDLAGFARVDFLLDRTDGRLYLNELNTLPGFTRISMFPMLWDASGVPFPALVDRLVELALERHRQASQLRHHGRV